jgi:phospholipase C
VISPWARSNFVDHTMTDQSSIMRFIEDNWLRKTRVGAGSFDSIANSIDNMFDFNRESSNRSLILDPNTGEVQSAYGW